MDAQDGLYLCYYSKMQPCQVFFAMRANYEVDGICVWCILLDFSLTVNAAPHECVIRTGQP